MKITSFGHTDVGKKRDHNEDNYFHDSELGVFIVCDGLGGYVAGEVASKLAVDHISDYIKKNVDAIELYREIDSNSNRDDIKMLLRNAISTASEKIWDESMEDNTTRGMGTTLVLMLCIKNQAFLAHVGDSRIYLVRNSIVHQLTEDHSIVNEYVKNGIITKEMAKNHPQSNVITRFLGGQQTTQADILFIEVVDDDRFLLCSDGLSNYLESADIIQMIKNSDLSKIPDNMIHFANSKGGSDNITAVVVHTTEHEPVPDDQQVQNKIKTLGRIPLFREFNFQEISKILEIITIKKLEKEQELLKEGDIGEEMYILLSGQVNILRDNGEIIQTYNPGDYFGEMSLIDKFPRSATIKTVTDCKLMIITRTNLFQMLRQELRMAVKLMWAFLKNTNRRFRDTDKELFSLKKELTKLQSDDTSFFNE